MRIKLQHAERSVGFAGNDIEQFEPDPTRFYVEIQADGNHETILTSEIYNTRQAALYAIALLHSAGFQGELHDLTVSPPPSEG